MASLRTIEVDLDPAAYRKGHDAQLDKAIEVVMQQLKEHPLPEYQAAGLSELSREGWVGGEVNVLRVTKLYLIHRLRE